MAGPFGFQNIDLSVVPAVSTLVHIGFCKINAISLYNHGTTLAVLALYDLARAPIIGVDKPTWKFGCPFASTAGQGTCQFDATFVAGLKCVNGLAYALVTDMTAGTLYTQPATPTLVGTVDWELRP